MAAPHQLDRAALREERVGEQQRPISVKGHLVLVGDVISAQLRASREEADKRVAKAIFTARSVLSLRIVSEIAQHGIRSTVLPKMLYGAQ